MKDRENPSQIVYQDLVNTFLIDSQGKRELSFGNVTYSESGGPV